MKIKQKHCYIFLFILFLFSGYIVSQNMESLLFDIQQSKLDVRLSLAAEQVEKLNEIIKMLQSQETLDRENFKQNALALIAAALRRAQMADFQLDSILDDSQKAILKDIKQEQKKNREFFNLKEGLMLTNDQTGKVKAIIEIYKTLPQDVMNDRYLNMDEYADSMGFGMPMGYNYGMPGQMQGQMPGQMQGQMQGQMSGQMSQQMRNKLRIPDEFAEKLKQHEAEKEKAIEKLLTPEQKKLFDQMKTERRKELERLVDKAKENPESMEKY
jgi:hypothetical protein